MNLAPSVGVMNEASLVGVVNPATAVGVVCLAVKFTKTGKWEIRGRNTYACLPTPTRMPLWNTDVSGSAIANTTLMRKILQRFDYTPKCTCYG